MFKIRDKILSKAINKRWENVYYPDLNAIRTVAYICGEVPSDLERLWQKAGFEVKVTCYSFAEGKRTDDLSWNKLYSSDLNIWKLPKAKLIDQFVGKEFDVLILAEKQPSREALTYVCAVSKATFKVGSQQVGRLFDLVIGQEQPDAGKITSQLIKILSNLKPAIKMN